MQKEFEAVAKYFTTEVNGQKRYKNGVDVGCGTNRLAIDGTLGEVTTAGGNKVPVPGIISIDKQGDPRYGSSQIVWDCKDLDIFADDKLDFIFSSHCLEDFENIIDVFSRWWKKIKTNGLMILLLPDMEKCDCEHCKGATRYPVVGAPNGNPSHRSNVGKNFMNNLLVTLKERGIINYEVIQQDTLKHNETASIDFVIKKL